MAAEVLKAMQEMGWMGFTLLLFALWLVAALAEQFMNVARSVWIRFTRTVMVLCRGWPPAHLDADGDWKQEPKGDDK